MKHQSNTVVIEKPSADSMFSDTCLKAARKVLKVSTGTEVVYQGENYLNHPDDTLGFQGKIEINADWRGEIIVAVPLSLATLLAARFAGCDPSSLNDGDAGEVVGEIANQIAGRVASMLTGDGSRMGIDIPEVTQSDNWHLPPTNFHTVLSFECINLPFLLIISAVCDK